MDLIDSNRQMPLAIITGASSGMGREVAQLLAQRGYRTVLIARRMERLERLAKELYVYAPSCGCRLDLSESGTIEPTLRQIIETHGTPQVLVNNAGFGLYAPFLEHQEADHRRLMEVNYFAAVAMIHAVLPAMLKEGKGHIINIASMSAKMGPWGHAGYAASKSAMMTLTQCLAAEHAGSGVNFSYVLPGIVDTDYFETPSFARLFGRVRKRAIRPEEVARQLVGLLDRPQLELCVPRSYRMLDWIRAISPTWAHRWVARESRPVVEGKTSSHIGGVQDRVG